jgi:hypothetical protein
MTGLGGVGQPSEQYEEVLVVVVEAVMEADAFGRKVISIAIPITTKITTATARWADVPTPRGVRDVALKLIGAIQTLHFMNGRILLTLVEDWTFQKEKRSRGLSTRLSC